MLYNYDYIVIYAYILHMYICIYNIQYISTYDNMYIYIYIYLYIMIRQRNSQEVKEHEKGPPSQTKEEEIGNLPEKEFRIMKIKLSNILKTK